jgi:CheY-like chemotaxis protein
MRATGEVSVMTEGRRADVPSGPRASRVGRVLVVEDEQDVAELIRYHLAKEGYAVLVTPNGADAVTQVRESRPDVVLLDLMVSQLNS